MKKNLSKVFSFLIALLFSVHSMFAQAVDESHEIREVLTTLYATLDDTKVTAALRDDFSFDLADVERYSGATLAKEDLFEGSIVGKAALPLRAEMFTPKSLVIETPFGDNYDEHKRGSSEHTALGSAEVADVGQSKYAISGPKLGTTGAQYTVASSESALIVWSSSNPSMASINSVGILTVRGKGLLDISASINGVVLSIRIAVGSPRFILEDAVHKPGYYELKAKCIDTEPGYAEFIQNNSGLVTYQWGIKHGDSAIAWGDSPSSTIKLSTLEDKANTSVYLKVRDLNGIESSPVFVRVIGYDIYNLVISNWVVNKKGELFTSSGIKLNYLHTRMSIVKRSATGEYTNARWNPMTAIIVNDEGTQRRIIWSPYGYMKNILPLTELERIKTYPNGQVLVYRFMLLNFDRQIIQKTPFTVMYKENYPN